MKIWNLTIALAATFLAGGIQTATAQLVTLVEATELSPSNIILPQSMTGMMTFKPCAEECDEDYERARLTAATQFIVNGRGVKFDDFRRDFAIIKNAKDSYALLSIDTKTKTVVAFNLRGNDT